MYSKVLLVTGADEGKKAPGPKPTPEGIVLSEDEVKEALESHIEAVYGFDIEVEHMARSNHKARYLWTIEFTEVDAR